MDYQKHYDRLIINAKDRQLECYTESHHIIPRCLGGDDSTGNLVKLTAEEHYIAHLLLVKMYPDHHGLVWAAIQMTGQPNGKRTGNKMYGWLKRRYQQVAKARTGEANGSHGSIWINKTGTLENKKIRKDEPIPDGWVRGRKIVKDHNCKGCDKSIDKRSTYCQNCLSRKPKRERKPKRRKICSKCEIESTTKNICKKCSYRLHSKLDWCKVQEIRQLYSMGNETLRSLADKYDVSNISILKIIQHKTWKE